MEVMNGRNTAKGQRAAMLACNLTMVHKEPLTLSFGIRKGGTAQRKPLPTPRTLQKMLHKYQRPLCTSSMELDAVGSQASERPEVCTPCNVAIQTRLFIAACTNLPEQ